MSGFPQQHRDAVTALMQATTGAAVLEAAQAIVVLAGYSALNVASLSLSGRTPNWTYSTMSDSWLTQYTDREYHTVDPILAAILTGEAEASIVSATLTSSDPDQALAVELNHGLAKAGYSRFDMVAFPHLERDETLAVILISGTDTPAPRLTDAPLDRMTLCALIATALWHVPAPPDARLLAKTG